jgi:PAS domain S-box-containing protein
VFLVGIVAVLGIVLAASVPALLSTLRTMDRQQNRFNPTAAETDSLLISALNQETGVRGYALTGRLSFLQPYDEGINSYNSAIAQLHAQSLPAKLAHDLADADAAFRSWRDYADGIVAKVSSGDGQAARALIETGRGKTLFDDFRARQTTLSVAVNREITANRRSLRSEVVRSLVGLLLAVAAGFACAGAMWFWRRRWGRHNAEREQQLADTAALMQSAIDATNDPIFAKDSEGRHILVNRARVASLTRGRSDEELLGRTVDDFVSPELAEQIRKDEAEVMRTGVEVVLEEELEQPDGPRVFLTTKSALHDARGRVTGVVGVARDITEDRELLAEREQLYQLEHNLANKLQGAMLGNSDIDDDRIAVCAQYQPAVEDLMVGGDWYDVVELPNGTVGLIVGDVVGRGIEAATAMGQLRSALTALAFAQTDPARALEALDVFARTIPNALSATCVYIVVDPANERLTYSSAGHVPPLVVTHGAEPRFLDEQQDTPLGTSTTPRPRRTGSCAFPVGSMVALYTDGLVERRRESIDVGLNRLAASMGRHHDLAVDEVCDRVIGELLSDARQQDDVAIVTARLLSSASRSFSITIPADILEARRARHALDEWLASGDVGEQARADIGLAVGEAVANSVEHAYAQAPGSIELKRPPDRRRVAGDGAGPRPVERAPSGRDPRPRTQPHARADGRH